MTLSYFKSAPALGSESSVIAMFSPLVLTRNFRFDFPAGPQCTFKEIRIPLLCVFRGICKRLEVPSPCRADRGAKWKCGKAGRSRRFAGREGLGLADEQI